MNSLLDNDSTDTSWLKLATQLAKVENETELFNALAIATSTLVSDIENSHIYVSNVQDINAFSLAAFHNNTSSQTNSNELLSDKLTELLLRSASTNEPILFEPAEYYSSSTLAALFQAPLNSACIALPFSASLANQQAVLILGFNASMHPSLAIINTVLDILNLSGVLLDKIYRTQRLSEYATYDHLTGLLNRRAITEILEREHGRATRYQRSYSVLFLDIDNFKMINDLYGHNIGDQALKEVALNSSDVLREGDWIGRWGGEEFICILPDTTAKGAENIANRLCKKITTTHVDTKNHRIPLTISIGIACYPTDAPNIEQLLEHADNGLIHAKNSGKNCVKRHPSPSQSEKHDAP